MSAPLEGRIALVTGAAGAGIGRACAHRLAADGATVVVTDAHERRTRETVAELVEDVAAARVVGYPMDVSDRARVDEVLHEVEATVGSIDVLVNNAAVNVLGTVVDYDDDDWDRVLDVDLSACWYLMRGVLPAMISARRGAIVNVSSVAGYLGGGREGPYAAAKAGLQSLTRTVAAEGGPHGVRANAVAVGIVLTRFVEKHAATLAPEAERTPLRRLGRPEEIAAVVAWLASDESSFVTGATINASGGWHMSP